MSHSLIDAGQYSNGSNNYKDSQVREWLNNEFYNKAFFKDDSKIMLTEVNNSITSTFYEENYYLCDNTFDKVWLPSAKELANENYQFVYDENRICYLSDYARVKESWINKDFVSYYYTRTPGDSNADIVVSVTNTGGIFSNQLADDLNFAYRPMIKVAR